MTTALARLVPLSTVRIADISATTGRFTSVFRLAELRQVPRGSKPPYHFIRLVDATGTLVAYGWEGKFALCGQPAALDVVEVSGVARNFNGRVVADIQALGDPSSKIDVRIAPLLLPLNVCPIPNLVPRLLLAIDQISNIHLRRFVGRMLSDKSIALPFMNVRGSVRHHHALPGGLLLHSVEVVEIILGLDLDPQTRDLCIVGGLFHDVGKIRTLTTSGSSLLGRLVSHEHLTLTICKRALDDLEVAWPDATYTLAHVWTAKMTPYAYERKALAAHIVAFADKISSQHSKFEAAFHSAPAHRHFVEWEDEWYWRPLPPAA